MGSQSFDFENNDKTKSVDTNNRKSINPNYQLSNYGWYDAHADAEESQTNKFMSVSLAFHVSLIVCLIYLEVKPTIKNLDPVTIELIETSSLQSGAQNLSTQTLSSAQLSESDFNQIAEQIESQKSEKTQSIEEVVVPPTRPKANSKLSKPVKSPKVAKTSKGPISNSRSSKSMAKTADKTSTSAAATSATGTSTPTAAKPMVAQQSSSSAPPKVVVAESPVEIPAGIDDLGVQEDSPRFETASAAGAANGDLSDEDLAKSLDAAAENSESSQNLIAAAQTEIDDESQKNHDSSLEKIAEIEEQNSAEAEKMNQGIQALKNKNASDLAAAKAAAAASAAAAQKQQANRVNGQAGTTSGGTPKQQNSGYGIVAGNSGSGGGGVRKLENLRQMPGNPKPAYNETERLNRQQGEVVFHAFISKNGLPTQFRQMKTTGYQNLDQKTLTALKKWRFYPGQEGWVEIPFKWDLRGGPQETSVLFKKRVTSN